MDRVGLGSVVPVEFFGKGNFEFLPENKSLQKFEVCWPVKPSACTQLFCSSTCDCFLSSNLSLLCCAIITMYSLVFSMRVQFDKDLRHSSVLEQPSLLAAISSWRSDFELQEIFRKGESTPPM